MPTSAGALRLAGRRILLTGAASGIGRATAALFAREGAALALVDVSEDIAQVAGSIGGTAIQVDLTRSAEATAAVAHAEQALSGLDGVVHCAGIFLASGLEQTGDEDWDRVMMANVSATFYLCRAAVPALRRAGSATLVTLASATAIMPPANSGVAYAASKGAVLSLTKALARDHAPWLRANAVCPGMIETQMTRDVIARNPGIGANYPLGRMGSAEEVASAILFLTAADSSYVTGLSLTVDGGRTGH